MELRLLLPTGRSSAGWSLELVLPPCRKCQATVSLDVGGRIQTLDMRGMEQHRRVTAELSVTPYRIVAFSGEPDPLFVDGIERECPGLPSTGAAAFSVSRSGELKGFPRAKKLRESETFALLWRKPTEPGFPEELVIDRFSSRRGWSLTLVTIPDNPSSECIAWIQFFTGLPIVPRAPSITPIWPFLTRSSSVNEVNCARTDMVLMSAEMMPVEQGGRGPLMHAQSVSTRLSAVGVERSPAFFFLKPGGNDIVRVAEENTRGVNKYISFFLHSESPQTHPSVELAFTATGGSICVVPLHQRKCKEFAAEARKQGMGPEYLSMPSGAVGLLRVDGPAGHSELQLSAGDEAPPHRRDMRLLSPDVLPLLISALADPACQMEIEFGGFGRLRLTNSLVESEARRELGHELRFRLLSFILQLRISMPISVKTDDVTLVSVLADISPEPSLIPHYRSLMREVVACGFKLKRQGEGVPS